MKAILILAVLVAMVAIPLVLGEPADNNGVTFYSDPQLVVIDPDPQPEILNMGFGHALFYRDDHAPRAIKLPHAYD